MAKARKVSSMAQVVTRAARIADAYNARGIHTVYMGDEDSGRDDAGNCKRTKSVSFFKGQSKLESQTFEQARREGHIR